MPSRRLSLPALCLVLLGVFATLLVRAPGADASSVVLCRGFSACNAKGLSNAGYESVYRKMWWRMYAGHNCTNYMAYRMIKSGMPTARPWTGSGDARNWGVVFKSQVTQAPMVGSVAWWSSNHVAYVEQIIDANTIVISEDHYGGDFDWRRITRSGGGWPTGFIHLKDERITSIGKPAVVGTAQVGVPLTASPGTWSKPATYTYEWYANGAAIAGAKAQTYTPTAGLVGVPVSVRVRATRTGYLVGATLSAATAATAPGLLKSVAVPRITGLAKVGSTLTATTGSFSPVPEAAALTWRANGVAIPGAVGHTYTLRATELGKVITAVTTARKAGYTTAGLSSPPTAAVVPEKIQVSREPALSGALFVGRSLVIKPGVTAPAGLGTTYAWFRDGLRIPGQAGTTYQLGAADLGRRISARVVYSQPGYTSVVRTLETQRTVRALAQVGVISKASRQITVIVRALGVPVVHGQVIVRSPSGKSRTVTLVKGVATLRAPWIFSGQRTFTLEYLGSARVPGSTVTKKITVR